MITRIPGVPLAPEESTRSDSTPAIPAGQGDSFMNVLMARLGKYAEKLSPRPQVQTPAPAPSAGAQSEDNQKMKKVLEVVFEHEGATHVKRDAGEESSRFGILQRTAEKYGYRGDVKDMTREQAEQVYKKIWAESGADELPPSLAMVHFDTYVNSPTAAKRFLRQSGGDTGVYLRMRSQRYMRLSNANPAKYGKYMKGWMNRIKNLKHLVAAAAQDQRA